MKQKQFAGYTVIKTEQSLHDFHKSLGLSGFFNRTQLDFLAVIRCYLMTLNVPVTPESITRIAADCLKGVLDRICSIEECKVLLQSTSIWDRYSINDWGALNGMLYELQFKLAELYPVYRKEPTQS